MLRHHDPQAPTKIFANASSYGIGAVLLQQNAERWAPVAYASCAMSATESRFAQIEKEALAIIVLACEKFSSYELDKQILLETNHKPLVPLMSYKHLNNLSPRVLQFHLHLMKFDYHIFHVPGKYLYAADPLSRAPTTESLNEEEINLQEEVEYILNRGSSFTPTSQ